MGTLSQRPGLVVRPEQKLVLSPTLAQLVRLLQLNRVELREEIERELEQNPVLELVLDGEGEPLTEEELRQELEAQLERVSHPDDEEVLKELSSEREVLAEEFSESPVDLDTENPEGSAPAEDVAAVSEKVDPFEEIDLEEFFKNYLDPIPQNRELEFPQRPSFETFLAAPQSLAEHLQSQLSTLNIEDDLREAAEFIIGNLDQNGYLRSPLSDLAKGVHITVEKLEKGLEIVQSLDPPGVGARDLRECLMLQLKARGAEGGLAWWIVKDYLDLVEKGDVRTLARQLRRPVEHVETALRVIRRLHPHPGLMFSNQQTQTVLPDVTFVKQGDRYVVMLNEDDLPQLRVSRHYTRLIEGGARLDNQAKKYIRDHYAAALQLIKNIEQRRQTILRVCEIIAERQKEFLDKGLAHLKPLMIKEVAEEIGVHPSTVSRAVANKYAETPQGIIELRAFFAEPVQGPQGQNVPLPVVRLMVKKMIEAEDPKNPLTDDEIARRLQAQGIFVTRRTVAKYREDLKIPSTHRRRVRD